MYRKVIQSVCLTTLRRIPTIYRIVSGPSVQARRYCRPVPQSMLLRSSFEPETVQDFSELDPDKFGTLSKEPEDINKILDKMPEEKDDKVQFDITDKDGKKQRRPLKFYQYLIKDLLKERKIVDAIDVLEVRMKQDKVRPDYYIYNLLINGCARCGYAKKAFKLYNEMRQNKIRPTSATFTGVFNACAQAPYTEDALTRLNVIRKQIQDSGRQLTLINYHALIKGYARLNDLLSAFQVVDEMLDKRFTLKTETFNFLLQACISDKECGLRHALITWHKMRYKRIVPDLHTYNLLIRCIRDCGFGDEDELKEAINHVTDGALKSSLAIESGDEQKLLESKDSDDTKLVNTKHLSQTLQAPEFSYEEIEMVENRPNLLAKKPHLGSIISVQAARSPPDRLLLLGGYKTLLNEMEADGVKPDSKTFNQLLNVMPSTENAEKFLMAEMEKYKVNIDIDFCNTLIKQRSLRFDYEGGKSVLSIIQANYLHPDLITFGVMAMCCRTKYEAIELIKNMKCFSMRLNAEIIGTMVHQGVCRFNFDLVIFLMKLTQKYKIRPNQSYMKHLEQLQRRSIEIRRAMKKNKPVPKSILKNPNFHDDSLIFTNYLAQWKKEIDVFVSPHPYRQFQKPKNERVQDNKEQHNGELSKRVKKNQRNTEHASRKSFKYSSDGIDDDDDEAIELDEAENNYRLKSENRHLSNKHRGEDITEFESRLFGK